MSAEIKITLILTEGRLCSVHIQHCTWVDTTLHLVYMMMSIKKTQY